MSRRSPSKQKRKPVVSGAKGGPSTSRGMNYQVDFAVEQTLDYISRSLCAPHRVWEVTLEPRVSALDGLTNWDVGFNPENKLFEIKIKPTRDDLVDWVKRVACDAGATSGRSYDLVYSKGAGKHLDELERLIRIANEGNGSGEEFISKLKAEGVKAEDPYLKALGKEPQELFKAMSIDQVPEYQLKTNIEFRARQLAGEDGGRRLREFLFTKFHKAVPRRQVFVVEGLIEEARGQGIEFRPPPSSETSDISSRASAALVIMQACKVGIPAKVIASALNSSESEIETELRDLTDRHIVTLDGEHLWCMKPLATPITIRDAQTLFAKALSSLLSFIDSLPNGTSIRPHVANIISLSKKCRGSDPDLVAKVFSRLDRKLKRIGNKRLVWFVANLSIKACRSIRDPDRSVSEAEAQALICGTSWAFQRLHKIDKARVDANEAYQLALNIRLDRSLAYCVKCRGRLCRMEAEQMPNGEAKTVRLKESVALLLEAIDRFSHLAEFGPEDPEVGDCYSLLGRTHLVLGELSEADVALQRAGLLIVDESSKDFIDLELLKADVEAFKGNRHVAGQLLDRAIAISVAADPEISEMRARAFFKRGENRESVGDRVGASSDYRSAKWIWESLQDEQFAAVAAWEETRIGQSLSKDSLALLINACPDVRVRVEAVSLHNEELQSLGQRTVARRREPSKGYWLQIVKRARERVAMRGERSETEW